MNSQHEHDPNPRYKFTHGLSDTAITFSIPTILTITLLVTGPTLRGMVFLLLTYVITWALAFAHTIRSQKLWAQRYALGFVIGTMIWISVIPTLSLPVFHGVFPYTIITAQFILTVHTIHRFVVHNGSLYY